jgi:hypothetical protein
MTTACSTIVTEDTRQPGQSTDPAPTGAKISGTSSGVGSFLSDQNGDNSYELDLIVDPSQAAKFVASPKSDNRGAYSAGTEVTIEVLRNPGWKIEQWVGLVYAISDDIAKVNMDQDQTVRVRMVRAN